MKYMWLILFVFTASHVKAKTMFKCESEGVASYQFKPCEEGKTQTVIEDKEPEESAKKSGGVLRKKIELGDFSIKFDHDDGLGNTWFAYKVMVSNRGEQEEKVYLTYKAVDFDGFEITTEHLTGTIPPNSYEVLTGKTYLKAQDYERIHKWIIDK